MYTSVKASASACKSAVPSLTNWSDVNWRKIESYVWRLQQRIYRAEVLGQKRKVRNLQRLLMRSKAALLLSIKRVTQLNKGKRTAGVDGMKSLTPTERVKLCNQMSVQHIKLHNPRPARRTYIPKKNKKLRPLGIPTIKDRVWQNVAKLALEPQWEARFESTSYGSRPKRSIHDAVSAIYVKLNGHENKKQWVFEGDFKGCFDNLNHEFILKQIDKFPAVQTVAKWLTAGYVDNSVFHETSAGTPQGGIISPLLANIALDGMEKAIGIEYQFRKPNKQHPEGFWNIKPEVKYALVRYADDFVVLCESEEEANSLYKKLQPYLKKRGLELAEEKTKVTKITDGFDFLGFNFRKWETSKWVKDKKTHKKEKVIYGKVIVKPSKDSVKKTRADFKQIFSEMRGSNVDALISKLNPVITGKANHWKHVVSSKTFSSIDHYIVKKSLKFLKRLHPTKSERWKRERYYRPDVTGQSKDAWILSSPNKHFLQLKKMSWTGIERHTLIKFKATPFNPMLKDYFEEREIKLFNSNNVGSRQKLAKAQKYKCPLCGLSLIRDDEGHEVHHKVPKAHGGDDSYKNLQLVHISCHIEHHRKYPVKGTIPNDKQIREHRKELVKILMVSTIET